MSCGGLAEVLAEVFAEVLRRCFAELRKGLAEVLRRCLAELRKGLAEVLRRSGGLAELIEIFWRPPQDFKLLHYVVIGPVKIPLNILLQGGESQSQP